MQAYKWFLLGMMVAWTPSLLALALILRRQISNNLDQDADTSAPRA